MGVVKEFGVEKCIGDCVKGFGREDFAVTVECGGISMNVHEGLG